LIALVISVLYARGLGPEGKGIYNSLLYVPLLLISFIEGGITQAIVFCTGRKLFDRNALFSTALILSLIFSLMLMLFGFIIFKFYYRNDFSYNLQLLALANIPFTLISTVISGIFIGDGKLGIFSNIAWIPSFLNLVFVLILFFLHKLTVQWVLIFYLVGILGMLVYGGYHIKDTISFRFSLFSGDLSRSLIRKGALFALALFLVQINYKIDVILLKRFVDFQSIGLYTLGVSTAELLWQVPTALSVVVLSRTAAGGDNEQKWIISKTIRLSILLLTCISLCAYILVPVLIPVVYGQNFAGSVAVTRVLLIGVTVFSVFIILNSRILGSGYPQYTIILFIPCLIIKIALNFILIPVSGILGAAWSSNISYFLAASGMMIIFSRKENISIKQIVTPRNDDLSEIIAFIRERIPYKSVPGKIGSE
jgi:O-antigen/teichoic acid export membrane protein